MKASGRLGGIGVLIAVLVGIAIAIALIGLVTARLSPTVDAPRDTFQRSVEAIPGVYSVSDVVCAGGRFLRDSPSCIFLVTSEEGLSTAEKLKLVDAVSMALGEASESDVVFNAEVRFGSAWVAVSPMPSLNEPRLALALTLAAERNVDRVAVLWNWDGNEPTHDLTNLRLFVLVESDDPTKVPALANDVRPVVEQVFPDAEIMSAATSADRRNDYEVWQRPLAR